MEYLFICLELVKSIPVQVECVIVSIIASWYFNKNSRKKLDKELADMETASIFKYGATVMHIDDTNETQITCFVGGKYPAIYNIWFVNPDGSRKSIKHTTVLGHSKETFTYKGHPVIMIEMWGVEYHIVRQYTYTNEKIYHFDVISYTQNEIKDGQVVPKQVKPSVWKRITQYVTSNPK